MNFSEYESERIGLYREFCETVREILDKAIAAEGLPRPQSIQCREKHPKKLRTRLEQMNALESNEVEKLRRDLAGARAIFYTDTDVDRLVGSRLIHRNFDVEEGGVKIHHLTEENDQQQYRAIHFTIRLKDDRTNLPEYSKFKGLRCEVQVQTVLHHAWAETSHDIIYKDEAREGFGKEAREAIDRRFRRIMVDYLIPAGYEFQRIQHDYERLRRGQEMFDRKLLERLAEATDNNERYEIINSLRQDVLPNYDDINAVYGDVLAALVDAAKKARGVPRKARSTPYGELEGQTEEDVILAVVETIKMFRNADIPKSLDAFRELYPHE